MSLGKIARDKAGNYLGEGFQWELWRAIKEYGMAREELGNELNRETSKKVKETEDKVLILVQGITDFRIFRDEKGTLISFNK